MIEKFVSRCVIAMAETMSANSAGWIVLKQKDNNHDIA